MEAPQQQSHQQSHHRHHRPQDMIPTENHMNNSKRPRTSAPATMSIDTEMEGISSFTSSNIPDGRHGATSDDHDDLLYVGSTNENLNNGDDHGHTNEEETEINNIDNTLSTNSQNEDAQDDDSTFGGEVRKERLETTREAAQKLESILGNIKGTTQKLLSEIDSYLKNVESVRVDYMKCNESQKNEARRLEEVEPDVTGATGRFVNMIQQGGGEAMMGLMAGLGGGRIGS